MAVRGYGSVLPIAPGRGTLVRIERAGGPPNIVDRREDFQVTAWDKPASLRIETTYLGLAANIMRAITTQVTNVQMSRSLLETAQRRYKGAYRVTRRRSQTGCS